MKFAYIAGFAWEPKGTVRARTFPLATEMAARGHEVTVFIVPYDNPKYSGLESVRDGVRIVNLQVPQKISAAYAAIPGRLSAAVTEYGPALVHAFKPKGFAGMAASKLLRGNRFPVVLDCDDWEGWGGWNDVKAYPWVVKEFIEHQEHSLIRKSHAVTCASRVLTERAGALRRSAQHIIYLPNGVSSQQISLSDQLLRVPMSERKRALGFGTSKVIFYAGHFDPADNVEWFCRAVASLGARQKFTVVLAGDGPELPHAKTLLADAANINLRCFGRLSQEEYLSVLAASDIAMFPYPDTPVYRAKCSARIIDYMLYGKPVVTTAVGQNNDYITNGQNGLLTPPEDVTAFDAAFMRLLTDRNLREFLGENARQHILQKFRWSGRLGDACENLYLNALLEFHHKHRHLDEPLALSS